MAKVEIELELLKNMHRSLIANDGNYRSHTICDDVEKVLAEAIIKAEQAEIAQKKEDQNKSEIKIASVLMSHCEAIQDFRKRIENLEKKINESPFFEKLNDKTIADMHRMWIGCTDNDYQRFAIIHNTMMNFKNLLDIKDDEFIAIKNRVYALEEAGKNK